VIVIGKTTAKHLPGDVDYLVAKNSSIDECIKLT